MINTVIRDLISKLVRKTGYTLYRGIPQYDMEKEFIDIFEKCKKFTITSIEGMYSLYKAVEYVVIHKIPGSIVECGVFKGGTAMLCAYTLKNLNVLQNKIYLYDTYEGMSEPNIKDKTHFGESARKKWDDLRDVKVNKMFYASLDEAKNNLYTTGYPRDNLIFVKGKVEDTIPEIIPENIALLRLDTDFYESTYHELLNLYPRLSKNGVIIIDDYGYWKGAREATDKYFSENNVKILLNRIDATGRIGVKI
jgi:hypothetical protein